MESMRILVHDYAGHPFQVELSRSLASRGHTVLHSYSTAINTPRGSLARVKDDPTTFEIAPISLRHKPAKSMFASRFRHELAYGRRLAEVVKQYRPDLVLTANTPSLPLSQLARHCARGSIRLVNWIQDLYGLAAYRILKRKIPVIGHAVGRYFMRLDRLAYLQSDAIVAISEDFCDVLVDWGIDVQKVHVIHNWATLANLPVRSRDNEWSRANGLSTGLRFLYSGTLGFKHNPDLLLRLALQLQEQQAGELTVISEGQAVDWLRARASELRIDCLRLLPFQPYEQMPNILGSADVLVAILEPDAGVFSVPSKVLTYLCAQRPLLTAIPQNNLAAKLIRNYDAGLVVQPTETRAFLEAATRLTSSPLLRETMGRAARRYAEEYFDIQQICDRFENILADTLSAVKHSRSQSLSRRKAA